MVDQRAGQGWNADAHCADQGRLAAVCRQRRPRDGDRRCRSPAKARRNPAWEVEIEGTPASLIAADDRLFAVTLEGRIYCFGAADPAPAAPQRHELVATQPLAGDSRARAKAESILKTSGVHEGYCVVYGARLRRHWSASWLGKANLRVIVIEPDASDGQHASCRTASPPASAATGYACWSPIPRKSSCRPIWPAWQSPNDLPPRRSRSIRRQSLRQLAAVWRRRLPARSGQAAELADELRPFDLAGAAWKPAGDMTLLVREGAAARQRRLDPRACRRGQHARLERHAS